MRSHEKVIRACIILTIGWNKPIMPDESFGNGLLHSKPLPRRVTSQFDH
jgi:hypothetical protein